MHDPEAEDAEPVVPPDTPERCVDCGGTGVIDGEQCPGCEGTGNMMRGFGGG